MSFINIKDPSEKVSFKEAVLKGLGNNQGLYLPEKIDKLSNIDELLQLDFIERSTKIIKHIIGDELSYSEVFELVSNSLNIPLYVKNIKNNIFTLELFHGPTLAFKDFGGRFMAQVLNKVRGDKKVTILTATSGDTGAAVAHAFKDIEGINVVILYPKGKISHLQEQLFCTLGNNIYTIAVNSDFDSCQSLVKEAFDDSELCSNIGLNSANSINISRLLAQVCYYFEAYVNLSVENRKNLVISVPSGNFGNLTAAVIAKNLGLDIKRFIASTNENDTVPRYLLTGNWQPNKTVSTLSNAMDVSSPNNWIRIEEIFKRNNWNLSDFIVPFSLDDEGTKKSLLSLYNDGYISEPHGTIAYQGLINNLLPNENGLFLGTAHPAKFQESVESILNIDIKLPEILDKHLKMKNLSLNFENDFEVLSKFLYKFSI